MAITFKTKTGGHAFCFAYTPKPELINIRVWTGEEPADLRATHRMITDEEERQSTLSSIASDQLREARESFVLNRSCGHTIQSVKNYLADFD